MPTTDTADRRRFTLDGAPITLEALREANGDDLPWQAIDRLQPGESLILGGGAGAEFVLSCEPTPAVAEMSIAVGMILQSCARTMERCARVIAGNTPTTVYAELTSAESEARRTAEDLQTVLVRYCAAARGER